MRSMKDILEDAGYETRAYSGRGMMGKECLSVELEGSLFKLFADVLEALSRSAGDEDDSAAEWATVTKAIRGARQDSMGLGSVVYFPRIEVAS